MAMYRPLLVLAFLAAFFHYNAAQQIQMPDAGALHLPDEDLSSQVLTLQRNISELWTYIYQLRTAVSQHLNHLRQHQVELEDVVHRMMHSHEGHGEGTSAAHTDDHHHSGEQHSHSNEQHSHGDDQHSHSGEHHSHGDDHHSHSGEHSHGGGDDHSHGGSHDHYHDSHSHSHSHSHDGHGSHSSHEEGNDHHHHDHKDSHEKEDDLQQSQQGSDVQQISQGAGPVVEPVVVPSVSRSHNSHHTPGSSFKPLPLMNHHHHHHHHGREPSRNRSRVVVLPKYSEYDLYELALCNVQPNRAIPAETQQEITGQIALWQKKIGGPLNIHVGLRGFDMGGHHGHHQQAIQQEDDNETPAPVAHKHGFHVHTSGDLSNGCQSTGGHYNPKSGNHGGPTSLVRHVGDLGNIECDDHGVANIVFSDEIASLKGPYSIVGRAIVIHALPDDSGLGGNEESLRTGNAGTRLACCVVEKVEKLPIRTYKAIKTAKQYQN